MGLIRAEEMAAFNLKRGNERQGMRESKEQRGGDKGEGLGEKERRPKVERMSRSVTWCVCDIVHEH